MSKSCNSHDELRYEDDDRPSFERVQGFLDCIEEREAKARRARFVGMGVAIAVAGVAFLTAVGAVPVEAEGLVVSAGAVVAGLAMGNGGP